MNRLACILIFFGFITQAHAEVVTVDVTITSVDAEGRSITVTANEKETELSVAKKAKISISGKDVDLDAVEPGQKASVTYDKDIEVVSKIEVQGADNDSPKGGLPTIDLISKFNPNDAPPKWELSKDKKNLTANNFDGNSEVRWADSIPPEYDLKVAIKTIRQNGTNDTNVMLPRGGKIYSCVMRRTDKAETLLSFWPNEPAKKRGFQVGQKPIGASVKLPESKADIEFKVRKDSITIFAGGKKILSLVDDANIIVGDGSALSISTWHNDSAFHSIKLTPVADEANQKTEKTATKNGEEAAHETTGCHVVWTISEAGDSTVTISRPLADRPKANDLMIRHDDATVEFQHDFNSEENVDRASMGSADGITFDKSRKALVLKPKKGEGASFSYAKMAQLPTTIEFETDGSTSTLVATISRRDKNVEFPILNLASKDNFKTSAVVSCGWVSGRDPKGTPKFENRLAEQTVNLGQSKELKFTIPKMTGDQPCILNFGVRGNAPVILQHLSVRGRLVPTIGIGLAEKNGGVIVERVLPKGLGETVGLKPSDVVVSINGSTPNSMKEALALLTKIQFGEESEITVKRNGKTVKLGFTAE